MKEKHNKTKQNVTVDHQEPQKSTKKIAKHQAASEQPPVQEVAEREEILESVVLPKPNGLVMNTGKEKKKKKSEFNTLQQLGKHLKFALKISTILFYFVKITWCDDSLQNKSACTNIIIAI